MNYLAHIFLSGENNDVQIGNFMGDAVKGKKYLDYNNDLQKGILLHRQIDSFTDQHPIVSRSKKRLHSKYGHYKGVLIDIFYDHYLAINWSNYSTDSLESFIAKFYLNLTKRQHLLPAKTRIIAPKLIAYNWLDKYKTIDGISRTLSGMEKRIKHDIPLRLGTEDLIENFNSLEKDFMEFFPLLQAHATHVQQSLDIQYEKTV